MWPIPLAVVALLAFVAIDRSLGRARRPEYLIVGAWMVSVGMIFIGCLLAGPAKNVVMLPGFATTAVTLPARFRRNMVVVGVLINFAAILVLTFGVDPAGTLRYPVPPMVAMAIVASVVTFTVALMQSDLHHRTEAFIDPLTGMLNRHALHGRIAELAAQAAITHQPIALILGGLGPFQSDQR